MQEAGDTDKFAADDYDDEDITSAQRSFFGKWERIGTNKWLVSLKEKIAYGADNDGETIYPKFSAINGFNVIFFRNCDESYTELNATITKIDDRTVLIELPSYYDPSKKGDTIELWGGSGTTLTTNPAHSTQTTFGSFAARCSIGAGEGRNRSSRFFGCTITSLLRPLAHHAAACVSRTRCDYRPREVSPPAPCKHALRLSSCIVSFLC